MARHVVVRGLSRVRADARSSLHPIVVETTGFEGQLETETVEGETRLSVPTWIELDVGLLKSNNALVDAELQRKLESRRYPRIRGELREAVTLPGNRARLQGELTLHGVSRPLDVEVGFRSAGGELEISGEKTIDMRDFNLVPPRFLIFKVDPLVRIRVVLVARPA